MNPSPPPSPPDSPLSAMRARHGPRYRWLLLVSVMVGVVASFMSSTIVNVAIPGLSQHFQLGQDRAQWVSSGFMVAVTVSMLTTPWLLARFGYRSTYAGAVLLLLAGGLMGGLASSYSLVLAARVLEGLAAGVLQPIPAIIILRAFAPHEQGRASGLFGMGVVMGPAIGPAVGGVLVDWFGWRSIFFMVVPFCLASLWLAWKYVPTTAPGGAAASRSSQLDWRGMAIATVGTLCLLNGLVELRGDTPVHGLALVALAALALVLFVAWQRRMVGRGREPLMTMGLFQYRAFAMGCVVAFIYGTALFGSTYLLPVYMQVALQLSASHVGSVMLPAGIVLGLTIAGVGRLADRQPTRLLVGTGLALLALSFAFMLVLDLGSSLWTLAGIVAIGRVGLGFILPSLNLGAMRPLAKALLPQGSSTISFLRQLGGAAGVSLCAVVLEWRLAAHGDSLTQPLSSPARLAAFNEAFLLLAALCLLALCAAWQLRDRPPAQPPAKDAG